jgi:hypothetical protein
VLLNEAWSVGGGEGIGEADDACEELGNPKVRKVQLSTTWSAAPSPLDAEKPAYM